MYSKGLSWGLGLVVAGFGMAAFAGGERITFPHDYKSTYTQFSAGERMNGEQYAIEFANDVALAGARSGGPLPNGAQLVMEVYKPKVDADGEPVRDSDGARLPGDLAAVAVMEKQAGWGAAYPEDVRNGDWDFGLFTPAGDIKSADATPCLGCHLGQVDSGYLFNYDRLAARAGQ